MNNIKTEYLTCKSQLEQVESILRTDPTNTESLNVKIKLIEVINLYSQLLGDEEIELLNQQHRSTVASSVTPADDTTNSTDDTTNTSAVTDTTTTTSATDISTNQTLLIQSSSKWPIHSVCEFTSPEGQQFPVRIVAVKSDTLYRVHFFGFGREQDVQEDKLSKVQPLNKDQFLAPSTVQVGLECEAKYYADGQWYKAKVESLIHDDKSNNGVGSVTVHFTLYGNTEEVPVEWLRIKKVVKSSSSSNKSTFSSSSSTYEPAIRNEPKILAVPDHLRAKASDTDKERKNKRKRMRSIQNKNRFAKKEIESNQKQASWQNFQRKATTSKKFKRGAVSNVSQFSLQGSGVGGKVGVIRKKG
jgi:hypothetical protein